MIERTEITTHIDYLENDITEMHAEIQANFKENDRTLHHIELAMSAINYFESELRMMDLVTFCQTGKYPNE